MLEIKNVSKFYKGKNQQTVRALDDVSVSFPETGMVFLLGKSGSGKSTMLNVIGGLDAFDSGEIIIKGKSSKSFKERDFDSYRNTYIGFIFQEYNILEEFTVEKNIALALELQGKDAGSASVDAILTQVDLQGYGKRKPNQLSGGQKQRVAIARALIKDPEIIMADEPSGALDSATGRQVFETLKKLSENRLVIVVSHDRDFAENYADRIIELKDGKILNDSFKRKAPIQQVSNAVIASGDTIFIQPGHQITGQEKDFLEKAISNNQHGVVISLDKNINQNFKKFAKMDENGNREFFDDTKPADVKLGSDKNFKLIRSRFKYWDSFKMGASGLKLKKVRLFFTVFLAAVALTFFGVADTAGSFNPARSMYDSMLSGGVHSVSITKREVVAQTNGSGQEYTNVYDCKANNSDIISLGKQFPNHDFVGGYDISVQMKYPIDNVKSSRYYLTHSSVGYDLGSDERTRLGLGEMKAGSYPTTDNQVAITDYQYENYRDLKYDDGTSSFSSISSYADILTKSLKMDDKYYQICGVVDTKFDFEHFRPLKPEETSRDLDIWMLEQELTNILEYGFSNALFFKPGLQALEKNTAFASSRGVKYDYDLRLSSNYATSERIAKLSSLDQSGIIWFSPSKSTLMENEVLVSLNMLRNMGGHSIAYSSNQSSGLINFNIWGSPSSGNPYTSIGSFKTALTDAIRTNYVGTDLVMRNMRTNATTDLTIVGIYDGMFTDSIIPNIDNSTNDLIRTVFLDDVFIKNFFDTAFAPYKVIQSPLTGNNSQDYALIKHVSNFGWDNEAEFVLKNQFSGFFDSFAPTVKTISNVFVYIGIGFAVFAALMMMSFITMTISYKKREIGILRAIGARQSDVYKIFFNESLIMTTINFIFAVIFTIAAVMLLNSAIGGGLGMSIVLLSFGIRQVVLLAGISVAVAAIASFLPVRKISKLKPIDAIQNRK